MQIIRNLRRDIANTGITVVSLTIGIGVFTLITLFLVREFSTDRFHSDNKRIYALKCEDPWIPGSMIYYCKAGSAEYMKENFTQVEDFCRIINSNAQKIVAADEDRIDHPGTISASENFFSFFSYKLLTGSPDQVLKEPNSIVLSSELAEKYFGKEDPSGKIIKLVYSDRTVEKVVTGIFVKPVENTQILFDIVCRAGNSDGRCYIKLSPGSTRNEVEKLLVSYKDAIPVINTGKPGPYFLEPLSSAYFDTKRVLVIEASRDKGDLMIALTIGLIVLGVALFNYMAVLSNKLKRKSKEILLRRIHGSSLKSIVLRITTESGFVILFSFLLSLLIIRDALPFFNNLTGSNLPAGYLLTPVSVVILLSVLALIIAFTLLFVYIQVRTELKRLNRNGKDPVSRPVTIPVFNIFQLACSAGLILCSAVILKQIRYIDNKSIGLDKSIIEVKIPGQLREKAAVFRNELLKYSSIEDVSVTIASPLLEHFLLALKYNQDGIEKQYIPSGFSGDENYLEVLGLEVIKGSGFSDDLTFNPGKCVVNESFAKLFPETDLIGKGMPGNEKTTIIGIVRDFNFSNLRTAIEPAFISYDSKGFHLLVKPRKDNEKETVNIISKIWDDLIPGYQLNSESVKERFEWYHRDNKNFIRLIGISALISIILSLIGLFAVSFHKIRSRTKEIGIRKINGAYSFEILALIIRDFLIWTVIACLISIPPSWFAMNKWLSNYAYRTSFSWWLIAGTLLIVIIISLGTVLWQSWRAATRNPVEALRYE